MARKKKKQYENKENVDHSQKGASHLTSDKSASFQEVSFDVLENAVERRNSLFGYKSRDFKNRTIISSDEMIPAKGGNARSIGKLAIIVLGVIMALSLVAGFMVYLNNSGVFTRIKHSTPLKEAIAEIGDYDYEIMRLNAFLQTSINDSKIKQANIEKQDYEDIKNDLDDLSSRITDIAKDINPQSEDYVYVGYAKQTIEARQMMIDSGLKIYDNACESVSVIQKTEQMWNNVLDADAALKECDSLVQSNSADNFVMAKQNSEAAVQYLNDASGQIKELLSLTRAIDFSVYSKYIAARLESAIASVSACQALLDQNLEQISVLNLDYIQKSNNASDIALSMPTTPVQVLRTDYDLRTRPLIEEFKAARKNAADNDFALRNFLVAD